MTQGGRSARSRRTRRIGVTAVLASAAVLMSGCSVEEAMRFGWPAGVTDQSQSMLHLWQWSVIAALVLGVLVWGLTFWTITFHRKKAGESQEEFPRQTGYNLPIELVATGVPFLIIAILFYFTVVVQQEVEERADNPDVVVNVTAFQWNWKFGYRTVRDARSLDGAGVDGVYDGTAPSPYELGPKTETHEHDGHTVEIPGANNGDIDEKKTYLKYDKIEVLGSTDEIPVVVVPTDSRVEFVLNAFDVIHSFWVPEFLFKRDVMPWAEKNHSLNRFQITGIEQPGAFVGRCAEMCGQYHSMMNFEVRAVDKTKFREYLKQRQQGKTNSQALQAIGEAPLATTTKPFQGAKQSGSRSHES